jgi:hypothetical protein
VSVALVAAPLNDTDLAHTQNPPFCRVGVQIVMDTWGNGTCWGSHQADINRGAHRGAVCCQEVMPRNLVLVP